MENTKVGARLSQEILTAVPTSRTIFGSTTVLPGMTMGRQDPGGLNAATSTGMTAHGAGTYNLNYYGVTADTPQNYGSMYYMDFGSAEEISVDTAAMGAEVGGGGGANINVIPKSGGNTVKGDALYSITGKGIWDHFTGNNVTDELRAQGIPDPTLNSLKDFNASAGGPFVKDRFWWFGSFRNYSTVEVTPNYTVVNATAALPTRSTRTCATTRPAASIRSTRTTSCRHSGPTTGSSSRTAARASPSRCRGTLHQESPKNLINGNWTSVMGQNTFLEVSSTYFHMHWPSTWADEFNALPASQQRPSTFNIGTGIYIDGPEPTGQRFRDAYRHQTNVGAHPLHRRLPRREPPAQDRIRKLVDADRDGRFRNLSGRPLALHRTGGDLQADGQDRMRGVGSLPLQHAARAEDEDDELRGLRTGPRQLRPRHAEPRAALLALRRFDSGAEQRRHPVGSACAACNQSFPEVKPPFSWNTFAPRTGIVVKLTEDGKNVAKASYSRYYEWMYTSEFAAINANNIVTTGVATYAGRRLDSAGRPVLLNPNGTLPAPGTRRPRSLRPRRESTRSIPT